MNLNKNLLLVLTIAIFTSSIFAQKKELPAFNDAEIAAIAVAANKIDVAYAELAKDKSSNKAILGFANTMLNDHNSVINQAVDLVTKLGVKPQENSLSKQLLSNSEDVLKQLKEKNGTAFDQAYIANEVEYHKAVIDAVRNVLIPNANNEELKSLLKTVLPVLETHLEHAESVRKNLSY